MAKLDFSKMNEWKVYVIKYNSNFGSNESEIKAPNKTWARTFFKGEMNPDCKIISINEK